MKPIHKTTLAPLPPQEAFDLFIAKLDLWWPKDSHSHFGPKTRIAVDPRKGGKITETAPDGRTAVWGEIIGWEPGRYLAMTWRGTDGTETVVTVLFDATAEGTRLTLTHGGYDILGNTADAISTSYLFGWDLVLGSYCCAAQRRPVLV